MQASDVRTVKVTPWHFTGLCYISGQVDDFIRSGFGECCALLASSVPLPPCLPACPGQKTGLKNVTQPSKAPRCYFDRSQLRRLLLCDRVGTRWPGVMLAEGMGLASFATV